MKKLSLILLAAIVAFIFTELLLSKVIGYPLPGIEKVVLGIRGDDKAGNIYYPHSKYWTVEGGSKAFQRNNVGLPGINVVISQYSKYICVLGASYIEAYQVPPDKMATSILQNLLKKINPEYQVINLGSSAHDLYDLFFRLAYYEKIYQPTKVILVLEDLFPEWLQRHQYPLNFTISNEIGKVFRNKSPLEYLLKNIIYKSSFLGLIWNVFPEGLTRRDDNDLSENIKSDQNQNDQNILDALKTCLIEYHNKYDDKFILVSIINNLSKNELLADFCNNNHIKFVSSGLNCSKYKLNKKGHLNIEGNKKLGEFIYANI